MASADRFAIDWLDKARFARACDKLGEPWPAWSTGEVLAVAVLLRDTATLTRLGYTEVEAHDRLRYDIGKPDLDTTAEWFANIRARL
ncbi:hypothetical protein CH275_26665 [Rhodococcus sp. 06-235-1A]|uniref:hypothetical protein n=1 Tax=Rhodococcus sp. 06-235-1A TaxID=2022508 RepID=UPI000B9AA273|nr:hypothetical protein [Rhodococcus sp. 06-235-1A]OZC96125.1 hypothetical protein CH275_26665 [Rhodococcus sp. 06-235-1A]